MANVLTLSGSPHIHNNQSVQKIMWWVVIALLPVTLVSFYFFGLGAFVLTITSVVSCIFIEFLIQKYLLKGKPSIKDGSAIITGILLALNVPSNLPIWMIFIGAVVAIGVGKMSFGGLGKNPFNPALVGRVFLLISFPVEMTSWPLPTINNAVLIDAITGPTSLGVLKGALAMGHTVPEVMGQLPTYAQLFLGDKTGSLGEVSAIAILLGGIMLLIRRVITWHIPVAFLLSTFVFTGIMYLVDPLHYADPVFHLLTGGLMLGAIFMATDMATSPMSKSGMLLFGVGCGVLTVVIRLWGAYPEGVSFAILIMNAAVPLINKGFKPKRFGKGI